MRGCQALAGLHGLFEADRFCRSAKNRSLRHGQFKFGMIRRLVASLYHLRLILRPAEAACMTECSQPTQRPSSRHCTLWSNMSQAVGSWGARGSKQYLAREANVQKNSVQSVSDQGARWKPKCVGYSCLRRMAQMEGPGLPLYEPHGNSHLPYLPHNFQGPLEQRSRSN